MNRQFGEETGTFTEKENLYWQQGTVLLEIDATQRGKIEKWTRVVKKVPIPIKDEILKSRRDELMTLWVPRNLCCGQR